MPGSYLGDPETLEDWRKALLLPTTYKVVGTKYGPYSPYGQRVLLVESDEIPEHPSGLTLANPIYRQDINADQTTYTPSFVRMEFEV